MDLVRRSFSLMSCMVVVVIGCLASAYAQNSSPPAVTFTAEQDHQNMMEQLGIKALRPVPAATRRLRITPTTTSRRQIHIPISLTRSRGITGRR